MITDRERLALLREKKIQHTLDKKRQNGYMDSDDYGTVPLPEGYRFMPLPTADRDFFYGAIGNALKLSGHASKPSGLRGSAGENVRPLGGHDALLPFRQL
jgi:hypothetical protein